MACLKAETDPRQLRSVKEQNIPRTNPPGQALRNGERAGSSPQGYLGRGGSATVGSLGVWSKENTGLGFPIGFSGWK